jgi:hypothetical protein
MRRDFIEPNQIRLGDAETAIFGEIADANELVRAGRVVTRCVGPPERDAKLHVGDFSKLCLRWFHGISAPSLTDLLTGRRYAHVTDREEPFGGRVPAGVDASIHGEIIRTGPPDSGLQRPAISPSSQVLTSDPAAKLLDF